MKAVFHTFLYLLKVASCAFLLIFCIALVLGYKTLAMQAITAAAFTFAIFFFFLLFTFESPIEKCERQREKRLQDAYREAEE